VTKPLIPVILCGGAGSRLWPASREGFPKQLLAFDGDRSLFQATLLRVTGPDFARPIIVTGNDYRFLIAEQLLEAGVEADIVLEPMRRDSCAAIVAAAAVAYRRDPSALALVLAADHAIPDTAAFLVHVERGIAAASAGRIVTFGIAPDRPATSYGYISPGPALDGAPGVNAVAAFVEKPDAPTAQRYVDQGYLWNSGNFLFPVAGLLEEARRLAPEVAGPAEAAVAGAGHDLDFLRLDREAFAGAKAISFDYAVMERTDLAAVVPSQFVWSDVGSWSAVWELAPRDEDGNAAIGDAIFEGSRDTYIHSSGILTAAVGVEGLAIVAMRDAVLVMDQARSQDLKAVVARLAAQGRSEAVEHRRIYRPWGDYESLDRGGTYQVKRITVKPGGRLSLQSHRFRAEHWVVVSGTATVTIDGTVTVLQPNQSIYVPLGAVHRLENTTDRPLELIEVQSGTYFGEDDIVRYEDVYNRG